MVAGERRARESKFFIRFYNIFHAHGRVVLTAARTERHWRRRCNFTRCAPEQSLSALDMCWSIFFLYIFFRVVSQALYANRITLRARNEHTIFHCINLLFVSLSIVRPPLPPSHPTSIVWCHRIDVKREVEQNLMWNKREYYVHDDHLLSQPSSFALFLPNKFSTTI